MHTYVSRIVVSDSVARSLGRSFSSKRERAKMRPLRSQGPFFRELAPLGRAVSKVAYVGMCPTLHVPSARLPCARLPRALHTPAPACVPSYNIMHCARMPIAHRPIDRSLPA